MNSIRTQYILASLIAAVALAANGQAQSFLTEGLVAYYPFNGSANDESGNRHDGIVNGATLVADRFGVVDSAYHFDGTLSYVTAPVHNGVFSNDFTAHILAVC